MVAPFELARTWLLERMYTRPSASRTRAPIVPAVIAGCPTENPVGAGRRRRVRSLKALHPPGDWTGTGNPSSPCRRGGEAPPPAGVQNPPPPLRRPPPP